MLYLVLFSYAFFFRGYTGLTVTVGAIATLFVAMQMTGHKTPSVFQRYNIVSDGDLKDAARKLDARIHF